jgi:hypothetical protein
MNCHNQSTVGTLNLCMRGRYDAEQVRAAMEQIRLLPDVLRVRLDAEFGRLEIMFQGSLDRLLFPIQTALRPPTRSVVAVPKP